MDPSENTEMMEYQEASTEGNKMSRNDAEEDKSLYYACNICGKSFPFQSSLSQHMRKHTGDKPYKCPYCDHRASQKGNLKIHIRTHKMGTLSHGHDEEEVGEGQLAEAGVSEGLDGCTSPTKSTSACNRIMNGAAKDEDGKILLRSVKKEKLAGSAGEGGKGSSFQCSFCKRRLSNKEELEQHVQVFHKPYRCRLCSFKALREDQLLSHIEKVHITVEAPVREAVESEAVKGEQGAGEGDFPCEVCSQVFSQAWFLKAHMKKHVGTFDHGCHICGRRFKESWFLKNHMKSHGPKTSSKSKLKSDLEPVTTINDVVQDEMAMVSGLFLYELCPKCGNIFHDRESLRKHEKVHSHNSETIQPGKKKPSSESESTTQKCFFMECLNLQPSGVMEESSDRKSGKRIPELDPVCSYQAWQLATKGKVAEVSENGKYFGWDEVLADADVAYDREKGEYILVGREKRKREPDSHSSGSGKRRCSTNNHSSSSSSCSSSSGSSHTHQRGEKCSYASPGDLSPESLSDSDYRPSSRQSRRSSQNKNTECFECGKVFRTYHQMVLHSRVHRKETRSSSESGRASRGERCGSTSDGESGSVSRPSSPGSASITEGSPASVAGEDGAEDPSEEGAQPLSPDEKPYTCSHCDFTTTESSLFMSHMKDQHVASRPFVNELAISEVEPSHGSSPQSKLRDQGENGRCSKMSSKIAQQPCDPSDFYKCLKEAVTDPRPGQAEFRRSAGQRSSEKPPVEGGKSSGHEKESGLQDENDTTPLNLSTCSKPQSSSDSVTEDLSTSPAENALVRHQCLYCPHTTCYPEVLWMHQRISHKISSNEMAPKWVQKNGFKGPKESLAFLSQRRRTGPPPVLDGKECQPLPGPRITRTRPPQQSGSQTPKDRACSSQPSTSQGRDSCTADKAGPNVSGLHHIKKHKPGNPQGNCSKHGEAGHVRPKVDIYPKVAPAGAFEKNVGAPQRPPGNQKSGGRHMEKYLLPPEGLGFMLSTKHGLSEHTKAKAFSTQPPSYHSPLKGQQKNRQDITPVTSTQRDPRGDARAIEGYSTSGRMLGGSQTHSGAAPGSPSLQILMKQEQLSEGPETSVDILSFLKNCNTHDLATLYHRWGSNNPMLDQTGMLRSPVRQGDYVCKECGKNFNQPSHLRTHMRSHTVVFESNGLRGTEVHTTSADASKQGRDRSSADTVRTVPLRKET
ncbi:zinc finger protein 516 [Lepisosteus oculatus]|uniref:Zinc finger protein 516 n=1 Tax=Lepisosteus oculatus TaxID=7918 RepID=W5M8N5_LEPOC|nr:PREDICTED: zinc finger protein 516 isoform X1 [Lepisosteus oculatus]XP_015212638.1 PREDICTED: zinc finger protein 516 isoform X1 [Lepisosteus oculatus]XP_015212639.1 PREDICTED: zinc finger protein 516 isoform X1 [Lepisosteus oculatus]XP_015212640.1 PREDICTED: zinc finger protein 516 isoform X1 [Lepisosteus oculatus]